MKLDEFKDLIAKSLVHKVNGDIKSEVDNDVMKIDTWHVGNYHFDSDDGVVFETTPTGGNFGSKMFIPIPDTCDDITENADVVISALHSLSDKAHEL